MPHPNIPDYLRLIEGGPRGQGDTPTKTSSLDENLASIRRATISALFTAYIHQEPNERYNISDKTNYLLKHFQTTHKEEAATMDWQEKYIDKLDRDVSEIKASLKSTEDHITQIVGQSLGEMRDRDNQRHQEFLNIRSFLNEERRWVIAMAVTTILGVAAMVITILITGFTGSPPPAQ